MTELKPCPFCGGEARLWPVIMPFDADCDEITIQCVECDVIGAKVLVDQDQHGQPDLPGLEAEAIEAWNTRAIPRATGDDGELVERIEGCIANAEHNDEWETLIDARDRITALSAEVARLNRLINSTGDHWLALVAVHPVQWEGAIDAAMEAACNEIKRLAALGAKP